MQLACQLEAHAPKPGNVSPGRPFRDMTYDDFLISSEAIVPAFRHAGQHGIGRTVLAAVRATRGRVAVNTNLGIVLLLAPLAKAALAPGAESLRTRLARVLASTTIDDAAHVYEAIRVANPGGLGAAPEEDVHASPTVTLRQAMELAAHRDAVAAEYVSDFAVTFGVGAPTLLAARADGLSWDDAVVACQLALLEAQPDTLIIRKLGLPAAEEVQSAARAANALGGVRTAAGRAAIHDLDAHLRDPANRRNPGATADLVAAACFVAILPA